VVRFSRRWARVDVPRVAAAGAGLVFLLILGAYGYGLTSSSARWGGLAAAIALLGIGFSGLLYAWRAVTGFDE